MRYTREQVLDAHFARKIADDPISPGDVAAIWRRSIGPQKEMIGLRPEDALAAWEDRFRRGSAILEQACLVVSQRTPKCAELIDLPQSKDSPLVPVDEEYLNMRPTVRYAVLVAKSLAAGGSPPSLAR